MTEPEPVQQIDRTYVLFRGRKLSYFSGCDYFRLASHPRIVAALKEGLADYGLNVAASRLTSGNHRVYSRLELALRQFFRAPEAILVTSGYVTASVVAQALAGRFSHVLLDSEAHPALADGARFFDCPVLRFEHRSGAAVAAAVRRCGPGSSLILLTDGVFPRDGSVAPLADYARVLPRDGWMLVDDAHAAGVLGRTGKGTWEWTGVNRRRLIQTVTLSKAFGVYGGAILGTAGLRKAIVSRSQTFVGSTPLPLPLANAALEAVKVLKRDSSFRKRLLENSRIMAEGLSGCGLISRQPAAPIFAIVPRNTRQGARARQKLLRAGIYPPFIVYPGAPAGGYFRFVLSSEHTRDQVNHLITVLRSTFAVL